MGDTPPKEQEIVQQPQQPVKEVKMVFSQYLPYLPPSPTTQPSPTVESARSQGEKKRKHRSRTPMMNSFSEVTSDTSKNKRPRVSLEQTYQMLDPWNPYFLRCAMVQFLAMVSYGYSIKMLMQSRSNADQFQYSCAKSVNASVIDLEGRVFLANTVDYQTSTNKGDALKAWMILEQIMRLLCILLAFSTNIFLIVPQRTLFLIGCFMAVVTSLLFIPNIYVWNLVAFSIGVLGTNLTWPIIFAIVVESTPKHFRDFQMIFLVTAGLLGELVALLLILLIKDQHHIMIFGTCFWLCVCVAVYFLATDSLVYLIHMRRVEQAKKKVEQHAEWSGIHIEFDQLVDDVMYAGRVPEPETTFKMFTAACKNAKLLKYYGFALLLRYVSKVEHNLVRKQYAFYYPVLTEFTREVLLTVGGAAFSFVFVAVLAKIVCLCLGFSELIWGQIVATIPSKKLSKKLTYLKGPMEPSKIHINGDYNVNARNRALVLRRTGKNLWVRGMMLVGMHFRVLRAFKVDGMKRFGKTAPGMTAEAAERWRHSYRKYRHQKHQEKKAAEAQATVEGETVGKAKMPADLKEKRKTFKQIKNLAGTQHPPKHHNKNKEKKDRTAVDMEEIDLEK